MATRNPWPWAIVLAFVIFIAATSGLIVLACHQRADLVSADYYEQELRYQERLEDTGRARSLSADPDVAYDPQRQELAVTLPVDHRGRAVEGRVHLYRPSAAKLDREFVFKPDAAGRQLYPGTALRSGLWRVRVSWTDRGENFWSDQRLVVKETGTAARADRSARP